MSSDRVLRVGVVAWEVHQDSRMEDNLARAGELVVRAVARGAQAIGFTEYFPILGTGVDFQDAAERPGEGPVTSWAVETAARHGLEIWCPFVELGSEGRRYNSVAVVDPQEAIVGVAQEFHYLALENMGLTPGEEVRTFRRPWGTLGCFVCFDIHYPEAARTLAMRGAELVFWPTMTVGPWSVEAVRTKAITRCMDNGFWLVESNLACQPPYAPYAGRSQPGSCVIDPEGVVVADTGRRPGVVVVDVDLSRGSFGRGVICLDRGKPCEDLREGFRECLRPEYYAKAYGSFGEGD